MSDINESFKVAIPQFVGTRQAHLFKTLKVPQFTGKLIFTAKNGTQWVFFMYLGRISYATGGIHPCRRWRRNVLKYAPEVLHVLDTFDPKIFNNKQFIHNWEYNLFSLLIDEKILNPSVTNKIIRGIIQEILFDLTRAMEVNFDIVEDKNPSSPLVFIDTEPIIVEVWQDWQRWLGAKLADRSPNKAPIIRHHGELNRRTSPQTYQIMKKLFNGKNTLRDLHIQLNQDIVSMTRMMIPYFQLGLIELTLTEDIPLPWLVKFKPSSIHGNNIKALCITEQEQVVKDVKTTVTGLDYQFNSFSRGDLAIAFAQQNNPQVIFVDKEISSVNAYDLISKFKKTTAFQQIPIVLITDDLSKIEPEDYKSVGFCDVLIKPLHDQHIIKILNKNVTSTP
ncbi:two component signal transduction system response regulator PixG [Cyanobacterium sp. HL-69]|uniref:response regulator n=1 Tax=Cyanobacterium sp. HL-69 TaxID=2054282 RepID=UPI000CA342E1|nr:two component signal transduction system response regulator PixG [Cyanobacterium sp. HL-69]